MKLKNLIAAALSAALLFTACSSGDGSTQTGDNADSKPTQSSNEQGEPATAPAPSEIVSAVLSEIPITSGVEKSKDDLPDYYSDIDVSQVESASFSICASGAFPDEIAVVKCTDSSAAAAVKSALEKRLASQIELYSTYTPDEMYKLDTAKIYVSGNYAVFIALSDNDKAKEIIDGKLAG